MRTISLKVPAALDRRLARLAARLQTSKSAVLRQALEEFAEREGRSKAGFAPELAGCVEGPSDLATAKRHMTGYGR